ncbi:hypothetical protein BGZ80_005782 [Entomortierella chlamydospora]|uniref:Ccch zinc finger and rrm domain-containing protein n=1 Tax=Entomortierella chlamydospora TaxID=101097 RepID=A0A9P6MIL3_9FUNG|nr:hypothetical protein BGZ79_000924 [Entomortierella chlamydospora]KAG0003545.1 hypothetical protein BGZ80_005782 [Entomortierella chlamydospora]
MHIDDTTLDDLKAYLTKELTLISDADPGMLADYIIALLKHDKENNELKTLCVSQLEDFLLEETEPFVTSLFKVLDSKSYIQGKAAVPKSSAPAAAPAPASGSTSASTKVDNDDFDDIPTGPAADRKYESSSTRVQSEKHSRGDSDGSDNEDRSYKHARRDDDRSNDRRRRDYSPSRPSDDDRFGGRRGRSNDFGGSNGHSDLDRRGDRGLRQQGLTTAGFNNRNNNNNNQNNPNNFNGMNNNNNGMDRPHWNGPQQNRNNFDNGPRGNFQDQNQGSWRGGHNMRGGRGGMHGGPGFGQDRQRRQRCRDYDEKGYCMRGDMCPYDHGEDRIVVDEVPNVPFEMMGVVPGMGPNGMMGMGANRPPFFPGGPNGGMMPNPSDIYDPEAASLGVDEMGRSQQGGESFEGRGQHGSGSDGGRFGQDGSARGGMRGRGSLRGMRGGRGRGGSSHPYAVPGRFSGASGSGGTKTSLVVEHIPDEYNTIDKVNEFFKQFGSLTNIQVDQPAHKALIQYSNRDEASAAYNSPEVIFGNRFVKVYWQPDDLDAATFGRQPKPTGQVRPEKPPGAGAHGGPHPHHAPPKPPAASVLMTPERAAELAAERAASAAKLEENKKTMQEIQRQREALIQRQQEEQRLLMQKLFANKSMSQEDKDEILKGLKKVAIEVTKEPLDPLEKARTAAAAAEAQRQAELQKEAEKRERERLDRELEVLNTNPVENSGATAPAAGASTDAADTTAALKARLATLQAQAAALGLESQGGYAGRGRGGFVPRGRGRGALPNTWTRGGARGGAVVSQHRTFRIDNRSTKLSVSNIEESSKDGLKEHFESFGELESFSMGPDGVSATVQYKTRKDAETAMQQGSQAPNATTPLKLGWISEPQSTPAAGSFATSLPPKTTAPAGTGDITSVATETTVGYESEEDEDGERSWKR